MKLRPSLQLLLLLAVATALLLLIGWPLAASKREERLHGTNFTGCGVGQLGVRVTDLDGNPGMRCCRITPPTSAAKSGRLSRCGTRSGKEPPMEFVLLVLSVLVVVAAVGLLVAHAYHQGTQEGITRGKLLILEQQDKERRLFAPQRSQYLLPGTTVAVIPAGYQMSRTPAPRTPAPQERGQ